jgi:hypothetical protein
VSARAVPPLELINYLRHTSGRLEKKERKTWIIEENQPLNAASKKAFQHMIKTIDTQCPVLSRENIQDDIKYVGTIFWIAIQRELRGKYFSLTTALD